MASKPSVFCLSEVTVASQVAACSVPDPHQIEHFTPIPPKRGELASARAGENLSASGGK